MRVADTVKVHADLMPSAGKRGGLNKGKIFSALKHFKRRC